MGSGIEGIYPLPSVKNGGLPSTSSHTLDTGESQMLQAIRTKGQL